MTVETAPPLPAANVVRERRSRQPVEITNVTVELREGLSAILKFDRDGKHFSLWFEVATLKPSDWFFQSPAEGISRGEPGHFKTRTFNTAAKAHAPMIAEVMEFVRRDNLIEAAREAQARRELERAEQKRLNKIAWRKSMAGEDLYDAVTRLLDRFTVRTADGFEDPGGDISFARAAIRKADTYE